VAHEAMRSSVARIRCARRHPTRSCDGALTCLQVEALAKKMQQQAMSMRRSEPGIPLTQVSTRFLCGPAFRQRERHHSIAKNSARLTCLTRAKDDAAAMAARVAR